MAPRKLTFSKASAPAEKSQDLNSNEEASRKESEPIIDYPVNLSKLIQVRKKVVFVRRKQTDSFSAKLTLVNQSSHYVSFVVRPSNREKFRIKPSFGCISPKGYRQVVVSTTSAVDNFSEISLEHFGVFAVPIYDKRQLEKQHLSILWRAQGTKMFPYEAAEFHRISYILPKSDAYFDDLSIVGRISNMSYISRRSFPDDGSSMAFDDRPVDEETFFLNWPPPADEAIEDETMQLLTEDWSQLSVQINNHTKNILDGVKLILGIFLSAATCMMATYYLYSANAAPFGFGLVDYEYLLGYRAARKSQKGWLSWLGF